ncbi:GGDEF domain-containing protein [Paraglaciecola sp.]|uniref:GGDEF domain-containing protein n=1 Tax=Paraglaciecola sp. TaxID=1920173 RepID=UPI003EF17E5B
MNPTRRTTQEYIILSISGASAVCLFPFLVIRTLNQDWSVAFLDLFAVVSTALLFAYVYATGKVKWAALIQAFLCIAVVVGTIILKGAEQLVWIYPSIIGLFFLLKPRTATLASSILVIGVGIFLFSSMTYLPLIQYVLSTLITIIFSFAFSDRMLKQQTLLRELSIKDPLTDAGNRRAMEEKLLKITEDSATLSPSLLLIDIDEFRKANEQYGHKIGDKILKEICLLVASLCSENDDLYRFGGEEFVIICNQLNSEQASLLAEELRETIESHVFEENLKITISIGIAEYHQEETGFEWLRRADNAMYRAKEAGSNLCCIAA